MSCTTLTVAADANGIRAAAQALRDGDLVAFPTETVYGLGADARNGEAVARLYTAKGRPSFNPLIAHVANVTAARRIAVFDETAERLASAFWPGPLTLVLPRSPQCEVSELATAGLDSIAVRVPDHPVAQALLSEIGGPVVAPSANRSGRLSPTVAAHVRDDLDGRIAMIVDGGTTVVGVESTIVALLNVPRLLRPGGVPRQAIEAVLGARLSDPIPEHGTRPIAPGLLASHYAPAAPLRLDATEVRDGEVLLAFGPTIVPGRARAIENLSPRGDLVEAAASLFAALHRLDALHPLAIAVMPVPQHGLGEAINDRLARAAAPRECSSDSLSKAMRPV